MLPKHFFEFLNKGLIYADDIELKGIYQAVKAQRDFRRLLKIKTKEKNKMEMGK